MPLVKPLCRRAGRVPKHVKVLLASLAALMLASPVSGKDISCVAAASGFFSNIRTPAALVAGAALGNVWVQIPDQSKNKRLQTMYSILMMLAVILEFSTVFCATASDVRIMSGLYSSPMAKSTVAFLKREMELPFVAVRLNFMMGIVCFMMSLAVRALATLPGNTGKAAALLLIGAVGSMFCMINMTFVQFLAMLGRYIELWIADSAFTVPGALTIICICGATFYMVRDYLTLTLDASNAKQDPVKPKTE